MGGHLHLPARAAPRGRDPALLQAGLDQESGRLDGLPERRQRDRALAAGRADRRHLGLRPGLAMAREAPRRRRRARLRARRSARQHHRPGPARLCARFRRPAFWRRSSLFGLQCRGRCHYHRRSAIAGPGAADARPEGSFGGSMTMRIVTITLAASASALLLAGCTSGGILGRDRPDEFAVARNAPLVIPPDFALTPPRPGDPVAQGTDARSQALEALFGGPAPRSDAERQMLDLAGGDRAV